MEGCRATLHVLPGAIGTHTPSTLVKILEKDYPVQKLTSCLWFDTQAEEAVDFYVSLFEHAKKKEITHFNEASSKASGMPLGHVMTVAFEIEGSDFVALNGGPMFKFNEAISFVINCDSQEEIDKFWSRLTENGGEESMCGWLKDKYGLSWQIVPTKLPELLAGDNKAKSDAVTASLMEMRKIDMHELQRCYDSA